MSMTRDAALSEMAKYEKFEKLTAKQVLEADGVSPAFRAGLAKADLDFFKRNGDLSAKQVAQACLSRGRYTNPNPRIE